MPDQTFLILYNNYDKKIDGFQKLKKFEQNVGKNSRKKYGF